MRNSAVGGAFGLLLVLASCGLTPEQQADADQRRADADFKFEAVWRLKQAARNPDRFETRNVHIGTGRYGGQLVVCGELNGENGFGGMTGWQRFVMVGGKVPLVEATRADAKVVGPAWREAGCSP